MHHPHHHHPCVRVGTLPRRVNPADRSARSRRPGIAVLFRFDHMMLYYGYDMPAPSDQVPHLLYV